MLTAAMEKFKVVACPSTELSYTNRAVLNPDEACSQVEHIAIRYPQTNEAFVFSIIPHKSVERGQIAFNLTGRKWACLQTNAVIEAAPYKFDPATQCLNIVTFLTDFASRSNAPSNLDFDTDDMAKQFAQQFTNQALTVGQLLGFVYYYSNNKKVIFELKVKALEAVKMNNDVETAKLEIGLTTANTIILFEPCEGSSVKLIGGKTGKVASTKIFNQDWDFAKMGVGGLSEEFNILFRRAFANRLLPPQFAQDNNLKYVRGILLYGPPGTGKTLIARQIGKMLLAREPQIVNGPEILNKFVGESEANIRKLFAAAEEEQAKMGLNSGLHMIIFDEIDSICKARGNSASSSGVGDTVVNQLLTMIDGPKALNNVLLIGMTNRRDLIDEALMRPGRFELNIEIGLPNKEGRRQIFDIHTDNMRKTGMLSPSVDLDELAELTKNFTGAEIAGLIGAASSNAISRVVKPDVKVEITQEMLDSITVTREDFLYALENDVKPALGASEAKLKRLARPMIQWDPAIASIQSELSNLVRDINGSETQEDRPYYALLLGDKGSGLTTIAANMAAETGFPFIRIYQALATASKTESAKVQYMEKLFNDAARSELSCIVMDDLDVILEYCHIGPRFSNMSKNVFAQHKDVDLPKGHRMLVICTCHSERYIDDLMLSKTFDFLIRVPSLTKPEQVGNVLKDLQEAGDETFTSCDELMDALGSIPFKMGIKELYSLIRAARRSPQDQRIKAFVELMHRFNLVVRTSRLDQPFEF